MSLIIEQQILDRTDCLRHFQSSTINTISELLLTCRFDPFYTGCINYVPCMGFVFRTKRANERAVKTTRTMELVASMDDESFFRCNGTALLHEKYGNVYDELMHLQHAIYRQLQRQVGVHSFFVSQTQSIFNNRAFIMVMVYPMSMMGVKLNRKCVSWSCFFVHLIMA